MLWEYIAPPPGYAWLEGRLKKEYMRLVKALDTVETKRAAANALESLEADSVQDHSKLIQARIAALEDEIAVRESLVVFSLAIDKQAEQERSGAKAVLIEVELSARQRLGIPDRIAVPTAVLQNVAEWWAARERLNAIPVSVDGGGRREHDRLAMAARHQLGKLSQALANEPARVKHIREAQEREVAFLHSIVEEDEARRSVVDERSQRVAGLLG
jgi:hypothetical protein